MEHTHDEQDSTDAADLEFQMSISHVGYHHGLVGDVGEQQIGHDAVSGDRGSAYLLRWPANVRRLVESLDQARAGKVQQHELDR